MNLKKEPSYMVIDTETTGLHFMKDRLHGIGVFLEGDEVARYHPVWDIPDTIREALANPNIAKVGHNLHAFDAKFIRRAGLQIEGEFDDTMVIWNLVDSDSPLGLKFLTEFLLGKPENLEEKRNLDRYISAQGVGTIAGLCSQDLLYSHHPHLEIIAKYCCEDVRNTHLLFIEGMKKLKSFTENLKKDGFEKGPLDYYYEEARPLERVLFEMEYRGIRIDEKAIEKVKQDALAKRENLLKEMYSLAKNKIGKVEEEIYQKRLSQLKSEKGRAKVIKGEGKLSFSFENVNNVSSLLYNHCGVSPFYTKKGQFRLDKMTLDEIARDESLSSPTKKFISLYLNYKKQLKLLSTYAGDESRGIISKMVKMEDGTFRIFPYYRQTTGTGRLACAAPNCQNFPRNSEVKTFFVPDTEDEVFDDADYSQIELRVAAHLSQDRALCDAYIKGQDVHIQTAARVFDVDEKNVTKEQRQVGKTINFLTIYRGGSYRLKETLFKDAGQIFSQDECDEMIFKWFRIYSGVDSYLIKETDGFEKNHMTISKFGRVRWLPDIRFIRGVQYGRWSGGDILTEELVRKYWKLNPRGEDPENFHLVKLAKKLYSHAIKAGYNQPVQGFAASLAKRSMIAAHNSGLKLVNQVHDSITISRQKNDVAAKVKFLTLMENIATLKVPLKAEIKTLTSFHPDSKVEE